MCWHLRNPISISILDQGLEIEGIDPAQDQEIEDTTVEIGREEDPEVDLEVDTGQEVGIDLEIRVLNHNQVGLIKLTMKSMLICIQ